MSTQLLSGTNKTSQYIISVLVVLAVSLLGSLLSGFIGYRVVAFMLLVAVSILAMSLDIWPVVLAATLSALVWDFFFIAPRFTFRVDTPEDGLLLLMYFLIALINVVLTNRLRKIEKEVREKDEKAKTVKLYNTLLNSLSHELKTPIAAIVAASDNLSFQKEKLSDKGRDELVAEISMASLRLNRQVENLLNMSRLESGFIRPKKDWCDINELIYDVINRLDQSLKDRKVQVSIAGNLPLFKLDYGLMEQVLYNLLYNASVYTAPHTDIFITAKDNNERIFELNEIAGQERVPTQEVHILCLMIEDRGPGFPPGEIEKVFDKFYRLQHEKAGGTGLGLSIVKGFVEAHDGTVSLENVPHGARFTIEIPAETSYINNLKNE